MLFVDWPLPGDPTLSAAGEPWKLAWQSLKLLPRDDCSELLQEFGLEDN